MDKPVIREPKKPYSSPILKIYGTVQELTKLVGRHGNSDNGRRSQTKTSI
jgi:hypothetical protein